MGLLEKAKRDEKIMLNLRHQINDLQEWSNEVCSRLNNGRCYLMSVNSDKITVEDSLEAFGFERNGSGYAGNYRA